MTEFVLWSLPAVAYVLVQARRPEGSVPDALARLGASWGSRDGWIAAAGVLVVSFGLSGAASALIPAAAVGGPGIVIGAAGTAAALVNVVLRAAGEEVFFRGLLGGVLMRRLGVAWGNLAQAAVFLLPHLALLAVDARLWPILPAQFVTGLLLGWLRHRADSFVPGAAVHALVNLAAGLLFAAS